MMSFTFGAMIHTSSMFTRRPPIADAFCRPQSVRPFFGSSNRSFQLLLTLARA